MNLHIISTCYANPKTNTLRPILMKKVRINEKKTLERAGSQFYSLHGRDNHTA